MDKAIYTIIAIFNLAINFNIKLTNSLLIKYYRKLHQPFLFTWIDSIKTTKSSHSNRNSFIIILFLCLHFLHNFLLGYDTHVELISGPGRRARKKFYTVSLCSSSPTILIQNRREFRGIFQKTDPKTATRNTSHIHWSTWENLIFIHFTVYTYKKIDGYPTSPDRIS